MRFRTQTMTLQDGRRCVLRRLHGGDAGAYRRHLATVRRETDFLLETPGDALADRQETAARLRLRARSGERLSLGTFVEGRLAASATLSPYGSLARVRHRGTVSLAVERAFWSQGIGAALLAALIAAAKDCGYGQLELNVDAENGRAIALYERFGFRQCGRVENALRQADGGYHAENTMVLPLS